MSPGVGFGGSVVCVMFWFAGCYYVAGGYILVFGLVRMVGVVVLFN